MGILYVLVEDLDRETATCKIGYTTDEVTLPARLAKHDTSSSRWRLYCLVPDVQQWCEKKLHDMFKDHRAGRAKEIYKLAPDVTEWVEWLGQQWFVACDASELGHMQLADMRSAQRFPWDFPQDALPPMRQYPGGLFEPTTGPLSGPWELRYRRRQDSNEYYTPAPIIEAARRAMGSIDLDPASSHAANLTVRADTIYTFQDNGLDPANPWFGNVWLNPPYGGEAQPFVTRCLREWEEGNIEQAVLCLNGNAAMAGNKWFHPLYNHAVLFFSGRVHFDGGPDPDNVTKSPQNATVLVYVGDRVGPFADAFRTGKYSGTVMVPYTRVTIS